jgi:branched-chain amino acid transport system substrate-binding protein
MFAADAACVRTMETVADLGLEADIFLVGSCAAPPILQEAGDSSEGVVFSIEGPIEPTDDVVDGPLYIAASERYGTEGFDPQSAGTVSFRSTMNLYAALSELGADDITSESVIDYFRSARDVPSYDGHSYTCAEEQIPGLPALCAPQQVLARVVDGRLAPESDGWIDVPQILAEHGTGS